MVTGTPIEVVVEGSGFPTRLLRAGEGETILFLHGAAGATWSTFHDELARRYDVVLPEHPGFGTSPELPHVADVFELASHYCEVLATAGLRSVHVVGNSLGGWLASELAVLQPSAVKSLTLMAPVGMFPREDTTGAGPLTREAGIRRLYFDQSIADRILARTPSVDELSIQERNQRMAAKLVTSLPYDPKLQTNLRQLRLPAFVIWGEHDAVAPATHAEHWASALDAASVLIEPCGHLPHVELPHATARWVLAQLEQLSSPSVVSTD